MPHSVPSDVTVPGARLAVGARGAAGPLVIQLHGLTSTRRRDEALGLDLTRPLTDVRALRFDARGHGHSTGEPRPEDYRWSALADDALAVLDAVAPGETVHGVGQSMGAGTLLHAAVSEPKRFASLTLVLAPTAWASRVAQRRLYLAQADDVASRGTVALVRPAALARPPAAPPVVDEAVADAPDAVRELLPSILRGAAESDLPAAEDLRRLEMPVLLLAWVDDPAHPLSTAEALAAVLPNSTLAVAHERADVARWPGLIGAHVTTAARAGAAGATTSSIARTL